MHRPESKELRCTTEPYWWLLINKARRLDSAIEQAVYNHLSGYTETLYAPSVGVAAARLRTQPIKAVLIMAEAHEVLRKSTLRLLTQYPNVDIYIQNPDLKLSFYNRATKKYEEMGMK